jgi:hypothetical protein
MKYTIVCFCIQIQQANITAKKKNVGETNPHFHFGTDVAESLARIADPNCVTLAKIKMMEVIYMAEAGLLQCNSSIGIQQSMQITPAQTATSSTAVSPEQILYYDPATGHSFYPSSN